MIKSIVSVLVLDSLRARFCSGRSIEGRYIVGFNWWNLTRRPQGLTSSYLFSVWWAPTRLLYARTLPRPTVLMSWVVGNLWEFGKICFLQNLCLILSMRSHLHLHWVISYKYFTIQKVSYLFIVYLLRDLHSKTKMLFRRRMMSKIRNV